MLIDCGPTRFSIWCHLRWQDAASVINHLEDLFFECGVPAEILVDNDTVFCSKFFKDFLREWGVQLHFCCVQVPLDNGITVWYHQSVKQIAVKKQCPIMEAVYQYNVTSKDNVSPLTSPANLIHRYWVWLKSIDALPPDEPKQLQIGYNVGDCVWIKTLNGWCPFPYTGGYVTGVIRPQNILVDGMLHHVRYLRPVVGSNTLVSRSDSELSTPSARMIIINDAHSGPRRWATQIQQMTPLQTSHLRRRRRSARCERHTLGCYLYDHQIMEECSRIERQNEQPATSDEPISLHCSKRWWVVRGICRQNSGCKFGFIWL